MFSIIIPLYNKQASIVNTINSILQQSFQDFEIIVVDDGSVDDSASQVKTIHDDRIRLISKENGGVCSARNMGIKAAKFDYIALLDADDQWHKDFLLELKNMIEDYPQAYLYGANFAELYDGKLIHELPTGLPAGFRGIVENYFTMKGRISDLFCSSSVVIRKEVFEKVGYFDERIKYSEDIDMWFRIIANYPVAFYDKYLVYYLYDAENRAMNRKRQLRYFLPYYVDKYYSYKETNPAFYHFIMNWSAVKIKEIYFKDKSQRQDAKVASKKLDIEVLPSKYKYLFSLPYFIAIILFQITEARLKLLKK